LPAIRYAAFHAVPPVTARAASKSVRRRCRATRRLQLAVFAEGSRRYDIYEQMRAIAKQITRDEMQALAALYGLHAIQAPPIISFPRDQRRRQ
jgi:cytochrome c553